MQNSELGNSSCRNNSSRYKEPLRFQHQNYLFESNLLIVLYETNQRLNILFSL